MRSAYHIRSGKRGVSDERDRWIHKFFRYADNDRFSLNSLTAHSVCSNRDIGNKPKQINRKVF